MFWGVRFAGGASADVRVLGLIFSTLKCMA